MWDVSEQRDSEKRRVTGLPEWDISHVDPSQCVDVEGRKQDADQRHTVAQR